MTLGLRDLEISSPWLAAALALCVGLATLAGCSSRHWCYPQIVDTFIRWNSNS